MDVLEQHNTDWGPYLFSPHEIEEMELDFERDQRQMSYDWPQEPEYTDVWASS
jgi:hypothetical protein